LRPASFVMSDTPVEVQFTSAECLNYPCRTPTRNNNRQFAGQHLWSGAPEYALRMFGRIWSSPVSRLQSRSCAGCSRPDFLKPTVKPNGNLLLLRGGQVTAGAAPSYRPPRYPLAGLTGAIVLRISKSLLVASALASHRRPDYPLLIWR
jgi:hypothetical protein